MLIVLGRLLHCCVLQTYDYYVKALCSFEWVLSDFFQLYFIIRQIKYISTEDRQVCIQTLLPILFSMYRNSLINMHDVLFMLLLDLFAVLIRKQRFQSEVQLYYYEQFQLKHQVSCGMFPGIVRNLIIMKWNKIFSVNAVWKGRVLL